MRGKKKQYTYRSGLEEKVAKNLIERNIEYTYEREKIKYRTRVTKGICGKCSHTSVYQQRVYTPDFILVASGIRVEVKGRFTSKDRTKILAVKEQHPSLDLRLLFGANNKLTPSKPARYSDWCNKHNIKYAFKEIPEEWLQKQTKSK